MTLRNNVPIYRGKTKNEIMAIIDKASMDKRCEVATYIGRAMYNMVQCGKTCVRAPDLFELVFHVALK